MNQSTTKSNDLTIKKQSCIDILQSFSQARGGKAKTSYSIICQYDDKNKLDHKITVRDGRIDDFESFFDKAVSLKPDQILIKFYTGTGVEAFEIPDSENIIRLTTKQAKQAKPKGVSGIPETTMQQQQPQTNNDIAVLKLELENKAQISELTQSHQQQMWQRNNEFAALEKEKHELEKKFSELESAFNELDSELDEVKKKGGVTLAGIGEAALTTIAGFAAKNPEGKFLGMIPNNALAGFFGKSSNQLEAASENERKVYYDQLTAFCDTLNEQEFEQLFSIFGYMHKDKANVAMLFDLIKKNNEIKSM